MFRPLNVDGDKLTFSIFLIVASHQPKYVPSLPFVSIQTRLPLISFLVFVEIISVLGTTAHC